jgi:hypothetical protein
MSLDYRLTLAGSTPIEQLAERALPDPAERPTGIPPILSADLYDRYGFGVTARSGPNGYVDALTDEGMWEWEPDPYVAVSFHIDKLGEMETLAVNMLLIVRQVLTTGPEDAAFVFNGDLLLLARFGGVLVKHNREKWWASYPGADQLFPG